MDPLERLCAPQGVRVPHLRTTAIREWRSAVRNRNKTNFFRRVASALCKEILWSTWSHQVEIIGKLRMRSQARPRGNSGAVPPNFFVPHKFCWAQKRNFWTYNKKTNLATLKLYFPPQTLKPDCGPVWCCDLVTECRDRLLIFCFRICASSETSNKLITLCVHWHDSRNYKCNSCQTDLQTTENISAMPGKSLKKDFWSGSEHTRK